MEVKDITPGQIKIINTIISVKKLGDLKRGMISDVSEGRVTSTKDLHFHEADALIKYLKADDKEDARAFKMRGKILSLAHEMDWHIPGTNKINFARLNEWCVKFGYLHKRLDKYSYQELPKLVTQFGSMYADFIKKL